MATDLSLVILDRRTHAVVCSRWLGGSLTLEAAREALGVPPAFTRRGLDCWTEVAPQAIEAAAEAHYASGGTPGEVRELKGRFPVEAFVWLLVRDY